MLTRRIFTIAILLTLILTSTFGISNTAQASQAKGKLEIFSWWAGDEAPALDALLKLYSAKNPGVEVVNATVAGGSGVAAKAVLKTRMLGGNPPDSFQVHAGQELIGTWVVGDRMEPLNDLFKSEGWTEKFPKDLITLLSSKDQIWSVPVNIHRSNVMWYIPDKLKEWGVEVPKTWDEFFTVCETLKGKNVTPLALGPNWTAVHLFENVLLATLGVDDYRAVWAGKLKWTDPKVKAAWTAFGKVLDCTNKDAASLGDWVPAAQLLLDGKAAFNVMGDWFAGWAVTVKKLEPGKGFGWAPAPGTAGVFNMLSDSFGLPKGAPNRDNAIAWLKVLGSVEGQDAFNPLKGSIPARIDADVKNTKLYNAYLQSAAADWAKDKLVGSLAHGAAAPESFSSEFPKIMDAFISGRNADLAAETTQELADAAKLGQ
jgi:glucose/mannose transport system substrate-binding protein